MDGRTVFAVQIFTWTAWSGQIIWAACFVRYLGALVGKLRFSIGVEHFKPNLTE